MPDKYTVIRYFAYTVEILVLFVIQQTPGLFPEVYGARPVPVLAAVIAVAMFESETAGMAFGLLAGLLTDLGMGNTLGFHALLMAVFCYAVGIMAKNLIQTNLLTAILLGAGILAFVFFFQWVFYYVLNPNNDQFWHVLARHYFPRLLYTWAFMPLLYLFNRAFALLIRPPVE